MIQDINPSKYHVEYDPARKPEADDYFMAVNGRAIFMKKTETGYEYFTMGEISLDVSYVYLFALDDKGFFLPDPQTEKGKDIVSLVAAIEDGEWVDRELFRRIRPMANAFAAVTAMQLNGWYRQRTFCGRCGHKMEKSKTERAMVCPECGQIEYPKICPACIIGVTDGDRIVMTKYAGREFTHYALIAGFCEIGESFEDTVKREVMEEVGLKVKNVRYWGSQPWSFSDTLLAGFYCELDGDDEIHVDETELSVGVWKKREEMPPHDTSNEIALTGEMIEVFRQGIWDGTTRDVVMNRNNGKVF